MDSPKSSDDETVDVAKAALDLREYALILRQVSESVHMLGERLYGAGVLTAEQVVVERHRLREAASRAVFAALRLAEVSGRIGGETEE